MIKTMACFNYMVILGELTSDSTVTTAYQEFYASMINTPYLGSSIPVILPALVVVFSILFAVLSIFKLKNKALTAFKKVGGETAKDSKEEAAVSLVETILKGERAVLSEIDLNRKREERNKLLRFNQAPLTDSKVKGKKDDPKVVVIAKDDSELKRSLLQKKKSLISSINEDDEEQSEPSPFAKAKASQANNNNTQKSVFSKHQDTSSEDPQSSEDEYGAE